MTGQSMQEEICFSSATELASKIRQKTLSPVEVVQAHLERIDQLNAKLNAIVIFPDDALDRAKEAETAVMRGDDLGPLHGVPFTLKDCIETAGLAMTLGSKLFQGHVSREDAEVFTRLKRAGGILLGKTNMPEFALWWETDNEVFGRTCNPWNLDRTAGGSSGGEGSAIAAGISPLGLGTDLGGSIRAPSSLCGVVGIKPTLGRIPDTGVQPQVLLRTIHVGPIARTVQDVALGMSVLDCPDQVDLYAPPVPLSDYLDLDAPLHKLKLGWSATAGVPVEPEVQRTVEEAAVALEHLGLNIEPVEIPGLKDKDAGAISATIFVAEARRYVAPTVAGRESELTPLFRARYLDSPSSTLEEYLDAMAQWEALRQEVKEYFTRYDLFLCPTVPMPGFPHGQREFHIDGQNMAARHTLRITLPWDLTGSPAISVPFGWSTEGLPIGVQLVGRHFEEETLLRVAHSLEGSRTEQRRPSIG